MTAVVDGSSMEPGEAGHIEDGGKKRKVLLGLQTDPGMAGDIGAHLCEVLPASLKRLFGDDIEWEVKMSDFPLVLDPNGLVPMVDTARKRSEKDGWDMTVCITDLPRRDGSTNIVADLNVANSVGLISLPALGGVALRRRCKGLVLDLVRELYSASESMDVLPRKSRTRRGLSSMASPVGKLTAKGEGQVDKQLLFKGARGRVRLLAGTVRANRPWRLTTALSGTIAAAGATAAFGIFYSNIWTLSDALTLPRLLSIAGAATTAFVAWLIFKKGLWERSTKLIDAEEAVLYNASTVLTLALGVLYMYLMLFVFSLAGAAIIIPTSVLQQTLGHSVGVSDYLMLASLAASLGTAAGALGSGLEDENAVREATYSTRELQRRTASEEEGESES